MELIEILKAEYNDDQNMLEDIKDIYDCDSKKQSLINYNIDYKKSCKRKKHYNGDVVYEAIKIVEKAIIQKFKRYMNQDCISKKIPSEYIYNFDELCYVIDTLTNLKGKHKVWFKPVKGIDNCWEINFEEIL